MRRRVAQRCNGKENRHNRDVLRKWGWAYTIGFLGIFIITHTPALTDAEGKNLGLFVIDPIDDVVHLLSGLVGLILVVFAPRHLPMYFIVIGVLYELDAIVGMTMSRGLLDLSVFRLGPGNPDFSLTNWAVNMPHIVLATLALWIGFRYRGQPQRAAALA